MAKNKIIIIITIILILIISISIILYFRYPTVAVLGYHGISRDIKPKDNLVINVKKFEEQLKYLHDKNYHTLTLKELYEYKINKRVIPSKSILITFDDGYMSNYELAFPLLKKYKMNAVVFCIGKNIESNNPLYMNNDTLIKVKKDYPNIEIASHSYNLHIKNSINQDKEKLRTDFSKMNSIISTKYFAYPYGDYNDKMISLLKEEKYNLAFTFGPSLKHRKMTFLDSNYKIPRLNISNDMPLWKFAIRLSMPI